MATDTDLLPPTVLPPPRPLLTVPGVPALEPEPATHESARWRELPIHHKPKRLRRVALGSLLLVMTVSAFLWIASWFQPPRPVQLVLVGAGYQQNLAVPHNIFGWNSLQDLANTVSGDNAPEYWGRRLWHRPPQVFTLHREFDWATVLAPQEPPALVVYVAAQGAADADGAYLLADDANMVNSPQNRWRLLPIIEQLSNLPANKHKVLVLDATQITFHAPLGILQNGFADELRKLDAQIRAVPNLVVICASDRDQRSWSLPSYGRTVFGHFWIEGLRGAAHDADNDGRLSLAEVFSFSSLEVTDWIRRHEDHSQTPFMLPEGSEGRERAERIVVGWKSGDYVPLPPTIQAPTTVPQELIAAWKTANQLSLREPQPYLHQPQTWRRYLATLRRYEELLLAGNGEDAAHLYDRVQRLADQCAHDPTMSLASLDARRATGDPALTLEGTRILDLFASAPPATLPDLWRQQSAKHGHDVNALRAELFRQLVDRAIADPVSQLSSAAQTAQTIHDPLQPLPPEMHLLVMLNRDLPASARTATYWPLVSQALEVRQLAENATSGETTGFTLASPLVRPWVADAIARADAERQQAEDLLLIENSDVKQIQQHQHRASTLYQQAFEDGRHVLVAFEVRDAALAMLPEVCEVIGQVATSADPHPLISNEELASLEQLWRDVHALSGQLSNPAPSAIRGRPASEQDSDDAASLAERAARVQRGLAQVRASIEALWKALAAQDHVSNQLGLIEFPASTWLDLELREQGTQQRLNALIRRREDMTQLLTLAAGDHFARRGTNPPISQQAQERTAQALAKMRGQVALTVLGETVFNELSREHEDRWPQAQYRLEVFSVEHNWRKSIDELAQQIATRWQRLPAEVDTILDAAVVEEVQQTTGRCVHADSWSRLVPIAFCEDLDDNASRHLQSLRLGGYLAWQAERDWRDHWFAFDPKDPPYYQSLGQGLLNDAERVAPKLGQLKSVRALFSALDDWTIISQAQAALTPEQPLRLNFQLTHSEHGYVPQGYGALHWEVPMPMVRSGDQAIANAINLWPKATQLDALQATVEVSPKVLAAADGEECPSSSITVSLSHRGRVATCRVPVQVYLQPEVLVRVPTRPAQARILTVASPELQRQFGQGRGALAVVVDCSGSMGNKPKQPWDANTRYAQATKALGAVLQQLPPGTELSVWLFGEAVGDEKTVGAAEQTIRCVRPMSPWQASDTAGLLKKVTYPAAEPWNESAVVRAILMAKKDLEGKSGFKSLVALTDGIDNRFEHDKQANPQGLDVATALAENFRNSGIALSIVGFQIASHEDEAARKQFSVIESFSPPGRFYRVDQSGDLVNALSAALDQRLRYWVQDFDRRYLPGVPNEGLAVEAIDAAVNSRPLIVKPGEMLLRTWAGAPIDKDLVLGGGDWLIANLENAGDGVTVSRTAVLPRFFRDALRQSAGNWYAAVLDREPLARDAVMLQVALERQPDVREAQLAVNSPREVWWEVAWPDGTLLPAIANERVFNVPASQWRLDLNPSADAVTHASGAVQVSGWWLSENEAPAAATLIAGEDFNQLQDLVDRSLQIAGETVVIEGVRVDQRSQTAANGTASPQPCLIVSLHGTPGKTYWVRWRNANVTGVEHHHYPTIGRYVGMSWPIDEKTAVAPGTRLEIVPLDALKREAVARGTFIRFPEVALPAEAPAPAAPK